MCSCRGSNEGKLKAQGQRSTSDIVCEKPALRICCRGSEPEQLCLLELEKIL